MGFRPDPRPADARPDPPRRGRVTDDEMPDRVRAQHGMGDVEEQFREVTRGFEEMHRRVPDPILEYDPNQDLDDVARDAGRAARRGPEIVEMDLDVSVDLGGEF